MAAAITYHGVPGAQGTLFGNAKFFVAQRVPDRTTILDMITQNGGKIVKLDKQADMIIADHVRPDCPAGSLHWKFIKDSVDNGAVQEVDKYLINQSPRASRPVGTSRPVGSSAPTKGTRTAYTAADDANLAKWVLLQPVRQRNGNEIYKTLEQANNRHTWHSWRDRWVKKVSKLPQATLENMAASAPDIKPLASSPTPIASRRPEAPQPTGRSPVLVSKVAAQPPTETTRARPAVQEPNTKPGPSPVKRNKFTEEDDDMLLRSVSGLKSRRGLPNTRFFEDFAEKHPHHTGQSWRAHWTKVLEPRLENSLVHNQALAEEAPSGINHTLESDSAPRAEPSYQSEKSKKPESHYGSHDKEGTVSPLVQAVERKDDTKTALQPEDESSQVVSREDFLDQLKIYREVAGLDPDIGPQVGTVPVDPWLLWRAVRDQYRRGGVEVDWEAVAKDLGLSEGAAEPLRQCYADYVADFVASGVLDEPDEDTGSEDSGQESDDEEHSQHHGEEAELGFQEEPRLPPPIAAPGAAKKRQAITVDTFAIPSTPAGRRKRQRLDRDAEIPSTPDEKLGLASFENFGASPSLSAKWNSTVSRTDNRFVGIDRLPATRPLRLEPETQDFGFEEMDAPRLGSQDSGEFDISPSQQLLGENEAVTPVPLSFGRDKGKGVDRLDTASPSPSQGHPIDRAEEDLPRKERTKEAIPDSQESANTIAELEDLIDRFDTFQYPRQDTLTALMATSLSPPLVSDVLKYLREHKALPRNWEGVWTNNDDERLRRVDGAGPGSGTDEAEHAKLRKYWDYLVKKHTLRRIEQRRKFFAFMDEIGHASQ